jgi:hypothetical protein
MQALIGQTPAHEQLSTEAKGLEAATGAKS